MSLSYGIGKPCVLALRFALFSLGCKDEYENSECFRVNFLVLGGASRKRLTLWASVELCGVTGIPGVRARGVLLTIDGLESSPGKEGYLVILPPQQPGGPRPCRGCVCFAPSELRGDMGMRNSCGKKL